jgi:hypothetical protein
MQKNYEEYLRAAKETLEKIHYLTSEDRKLIERGVEYLERGRGLLKSDDPAALRRSASLMMIGGYYLGSVCVVSTSEKKYWDIKTHGPGGITTGRAKQADAAIWQKWVLDEIAAKNAKGDWIKLAALRIADKLKERKQLPVTCRTGTAWRDL